METAKNEVSKKLMQPEEVRQIFNITRPTEIAWRNAGKLPEPLVMGRRVYYPAAAIDKLINKG